jgi:hypothetical protein
VSELIHSIVWFLETLRLSWVSKRQAPASDLTEHGKTAGL